MEDERRESGESATTERRQPPSVDETFCADDLPSDRAHPDYRPDYRPLARGASVGRYVLLDQLGAGAMGVVYSAYDPELDRKVALKLLHARAASAGAGSQSSEGTPRLLREAQALAKLSHPNVVAVHDVGTIDDGAAVFLAMEFIAGETLGEWCRRR